MKLSYKPSFTKVNNGQDAATIPTDPIPDDADEFENPMKPSLPPLYDEWPPSIAEGIGSISEPILRATWPSESDCGSQKVRAPQWNEYPTVFMSPENKGFE